MKILFICGSLRTDSFNRKLLNCSLQALQNQPELELCVADLKQLALPLYDGDIEAAGIPEQVNQLGQMISSAQAVVLVSPEYNHSISAPLKNAIDWVSRLKPIPWDKKAVFLAGASTGVYGAFRGMMASRVPLEALGSYVFPQLFALPKAESAFSETGELGDAKVQKRLTRLLTEFCEYAKRLNS